MTGRYSRYDTYELTPTEQETFSLDSVVAMFDEDANGVVINHPDNGVLAGDRLRSRKNPYFDREQPVDVTNRPLTYALTDDYNAEQSVRLAEARRMQESGRIQSALGSLAVIGVHLPKFNQADTATRQRYMSALHRVAEAESGARVDSKKQAVNEIQESLDIFEQRGQTVSPQIRSKVTRATERFAERSRTLEDQQVANRERQEVLQFEFGADRIIKNSLRHFAGQYNSIADAPEVFLREARERITKPGVLTVNNAWYHRNQPESLQHMLIAQEGWEALYGSLMQPMSRLAAETPSKARSAPEELLAKHTPTLLALEDVVDMSMIGGGYDKLADSLREVLFTTEDLLINGRVTEAVKAAKQYRFLLRYRTHDPSQPPVEWYGGLPGVRTGQEPIELSPQEIENPFYGL